MKKYLIVFIVSLLISVDSPAQDIINAIGRALNGLSQQSQQRNNQRNNYQRTYPNNQRFNRQDRIDQQRKETQQRNIFQQNNTVERNESTNNLNSSNINGQVPDNDNTVTLVTSGIASTKEEATRNAIRNAIEQAFGTFVSANTEVLNDELIKDEVTTVSTGNIKSYKELSVNHSNGMYDVSVQAIVSIGQLTKFAQSKGMQVELAGASFAMNMKMRELNKKNEVTAIDHMIEKAKAIAKNGLFDYKLEISKPRLSENSNYAVKIKVLFYENDNTKAFYNLIYSTLEALSLNNVELAEYQSANIGYFVYNKQLIKQRTKHDVRGLYVLRNDYKGYDYNGYDIHYPWIMPMFMDAILNYEIKDNLGTVITCRSLKIDNEIMQRKETIWHYVEEIDRYHRDVYNYFFYPSNRIVDNVPIKDYGESELSNLFHFNPLERDGYYTIGFRERIKQRIYYQQEFSIVYSEDEMSKLNSITIEHRK